MTEHVNTDRDELRGTLSNTICNASFYPDRAVPYLLGGDMSEVLDKTTAALIADGYRKIETFAGSRVLLEVADERGRQDQKWGEQNHPNGTGPAKLPMPYGSGSWSASVAAQNLTLITRCMAQIGQCTWLHILREEVFEAFAEDDPAKLRAELIQVAAVAVQWVEAIDRAEKAQAPA